jgi:hypothetical protein
MLSREFPMLRTRFIRVLPWCFPQCIFPDVAFRTQIFDNAVNNSLSVTDSTSNFKTDSLSTEINRMHQFPAPKYEESSWKLKNTREFQDRLAFVTKTLSRVPSHTARVLRDLTPVVFPYVVFRMHTLNNINNDANLFAEVVFPTE